MTKYFKRFKNCTTFERAIKKDIHSLKDAKVQEIQFFERIGFPYAE